MGLHLLAEAILRSEHKLDALLKHFKIQTQPMHFIGQVCPVCHHNIDYLIDIQHQVVIRRCNCKTGKVPSTIPLTPVTTTQEKTHGSSKEEPGSAGEPPRGPAVRSSNRPGRKGREPGNG